jgi:hypothetical protein
MLEQNEALSCGNIMELRSCLRSIDETLIPDEEGNISTIC